MFPPQSRHLVVRVAGQGEREQAFHGVSHDSVRDLARLVAGRGDLITLSPAPVQRMLAEMVLQPQRFRSWLTRTDPACERKMAEIVKLYLDPPRNSRLLGVDEKTGIHALERWSPTLPRRPSQIARREFESLRHGVVAVLAAFDGRTGRVFGPCYRRHPNRDLRHFLRTRRARDPDQRWHLMLDNASYHAQQEVLEWCAAQPPKITLPWLPYHGSWLNQVEIWFSILSHKCLRRASVGAIRELRYVIHRFMDTGNEYFAHPVEWTDPGKPRAVSPQQFDLTAA